MDEFKKFDVDGNGSIDQAEWDRMALEDRRLRMQDEDMQRNAIRSMSWFALFGMLLYPFAVILADVFGLTEAAKILGSMASIYFISVAGIVSVFFGATALAKGKDKRNYKVSFKKILTELKDFYKPEWTLEKGAIELLDFFKKINFNEEKFRGPLTNRLQHLSQSILDKKIDKNFRKII